MEFLGLRVCERLRAILRTPCTRTWSMELVNAQNAQREIAQTLAETAYTTFHFYGDKMGVLA